jgi:hypothetical protein
MPCICHGAMTSDEFLDGVVKSDQYRDIMELLGDAKTLIERIPMHPECGMTEIELKQEFVKAFLHILIGCDDLSRG